MPLAFGRRLLRRLLLRLAKRMPVEKMLAHSRAGAERMAAQAARTSRAYQQLLEQAGANSPGTDFNALPILDKDNTFGRFTVDELARDLPARELADVLTSSGRGGRTFGFRLTARKSHDRAWFDIDLGLQDAFGVDERTTLLVNCLPMGVVFASRAATVANVSVREDMACAILRDVGPRFEQTLLCTDPLFVRRLIARGETDRIDWRALNTSVIIGEEVLVESQRDYIAAKLGIDLDGGGHRTVLSSFGVGELGLNLLFETRETIRLRRAMRNQPEIEHLIGGRPSGRSMPSVFCFNPLRCHLEVLRPDADGYGELCFTVIDPSAVMPLPRYATGDYGKLVAHAAVRQAARMLGCEAPWLPVAVVCGRVGDRPAGLPSAEEVKEVLYADHGVADQLTGAFKLELDAQGTGHLTLQAAGSDESTHISLAAQLSGQLNQDRTQPLSVAVLAPHLFPWRPQLDYERKFAYMNPAAQAS